ncbi:MAG: hypothetical protein ACLQVX_05340 [Limisphaerales bacterium]
MKPLDATFIPDKCPDALLLRWDSRELSLGAAQQKCLPIRNSLKEERLEVRTDM